MSLSELPFLCCYAGVIIGENQRDKKPMKIGGAKYFWIWILILSLNLFWLIRRSLILSCNLLSCWSLNMAYLPTELECLINIRVVLLQVFFLQHLESSDLNIYSKSYDLNTKTYTVWIWISPLSPSCGASNLVQIEVHLILFLLLLAMRSSILSFLFLP